MIESNFFEITIFLGVPLFYWMLWISFQYYPQNMPAYLYIWQPSDFKLAANTPRHMALDQSALSASEPRFRQNRRTLIITVACAPRRCAVAAPVLSAPPRTTTARPGEWTQGDCYALVCVCQE